MDDADLNEVMVFTRVAEAHSFSAAAKRLGLPKSTVSRKVSQLEQRLGVQLIVRSTRKLNLTEAGAAYYERSARAIADLDEAERAVRDVSATPRGTLRLTAPVDFAQLAAIVAEYRRKYPEVKVVLTLTPRRVNLIGEGIDLALRGGHLPDSSMVAKKLRDADFGVFASAAYIKKHGAPRTLAELSQHALVVYGRELRTTWKLQCGQRVREVPVVGQVCADDFGFIASAVLAGAGIGLMPTILAVDALGKKRLERLLADHGFEGGGFYLVYPSARHLSAAARAFIDLTSAWVAKLPPGSW